MKYTWLLFDADDTLFDFSKASANALQWTLEECGLPFEPAFTGLDYGIHTCWYNPNEKTSDLVLTYKISQLHELVSLLR